MIQPIRYTLLAALAGALVTTAGAPVPESVYSGMSWRQIGPFRGGRVAAVAGVPSQPDTYYLGAALGGLWKTTDGGIPVGADLRPRRYARVDRRGRHRGFEPERPLCRHRRVGAA